MPHEVPIPGAIPSPKDYRADIVQSAMLASAAPIELPAALQTDFQKLGILYQRLEPACVSHAVAELMKLWYFLKTGQIVDFSPRFLDVMYQKIMNIDPSTDIGGRIPQVIFKIAQNYGCATESTVLNDTTLSIPSYRDQAVLTPAAMAEASQYKIPGYVPVSIDSYAIKQNIALYGGVAMLMKIGSEWWTAPDGSISWAQADIDPVRPPQNVISGHEIVVSGWNASDLMHLVNSWSTAWAQNGESDFIFGEWQPYIIEAWAIADVPVDVLKEVQSLPAPSEFKHTFTSDIVFGQRSDEVRALQIALAIAGFFKYPSITGYFGAATAAAVLQYQIANSVAPMPELMYLNGHRCGPATRASLNSRFS